jgi:nicotinate phosphoribosyltransferase
LAEADTALGLATDLYELTMVDAYLAEGLTEDAVFSLFSRKLPRERRYLVAAGVSSVLTAIERFRFTPAALAWLESLRLLTPRLLSWLERYRFSGEVRAIPEGTPVFENEPLVEIRGPLPEVQLLETLVMNRVQLETVAASKASRLVDAARGRKVVDFGMRRAHGIEASLAVARAAYVAGLASTSNVLAGERWGIPVAGTMAHSYVQAHPTELEAFRAFVRQFPTATLLVDTYDTLQGVRNVIRLAEELGTGFRVAAVRLDSGDLVTLAKESRALLDSAGLRGVGIFASGGLDEEAIEALVDAGAPIDGFGIGSALAVSEGASVLDVAFKLVEYASSPRMKLSAGKLTYPWAKQVFRVETDDGLALHDVLACDGEALDGRPLLVPVMRHGERLPAGGESLETSRARARDELHRLPAELRLLSGPFTPYPVRLSARLAAETTALATRVARGTSAGEEVHAG